MKKEDVKFLYCAHCGNVVRKLNDSGVDVICCGEPMTALEAKTADAGAEKHVPKAKKDGGTIMITVGDVLHPMTDEHYIQWIALVQNDHVEVCHLNPAEEPKAEFFVTQDADIYSYCNLHGLWKTIVKK